MTAEVTVECPSEHELVIRVSGRLGLNAHHDFRQAYMPHVRGLTKCEVNLQGCTGIDSSGMAILLILRDQAKLEPEQFSITHCNPEVYKVLGYANFDQIFTVKAL
ncbi:STAS domain-containing protein [Simiduia litorea]|uniref:STAS domain-containing protein n=1 Tax=Simiduia litorea TaxID=1435348 RepID=UPI0036F3B11E